MTVADEGGRTEIELLLPWYAAGTLSRREAQRVESALAGDPELARRYELVRKEFGQTIQLNEALGAPSARAMAALFEKIDAEPARAPAVSLNLGARVRGFFASLSPRTLAWSASAAALAILLQAAVIGGVALKGNGQERVGSYETASVPVNASGEGSYALIRFQPGANAADIGQFLASNKLSLAGGPSAGGLYRVQVSSRKLSQPEVAGIVKQLQQNSVVGFMAPAQ
jgi:anti-sigma factor RsiW